MSESRKQPEPPPLPETIDWDPTTCWDAGWRAGHAAGLDAAQDLLAACEAMCAWFDRLNQKQDELLVQGQTLESAEKNWDAATLDTGFDMSQIQAAVAKARGGK